MDELAQYNKSRWEALARARVAYSRPFLDLTPQKAKEYLVDRLAFSPYKLEDVSGKDVLCLASGGGQLRFSSPYWEFEDEAGQKQRVEGPHEFLHTWSAIVNALVQSKFFILGLREWPAGDNRAKPGTWEHMNSILPPFVTIASVSRPIDL